MTTKLAAAYDEYVQAKMIEALKLGELDEVHCAMTKDDYWVAVVVPYATHGAEQQPVTYRHTIGSDDGAFVFYRLGDDHYWPHAITFQDLDEDTVMAVMEDEDVGLTVHARVFGKGWKVVMRGLTRVQADHLTTHLREYQVLGVYAFAITQDMADPDLASNN